MHASWTYRLRFLKKHLLMFLLAMGWLLVQSQVAVASHDCSLNLRGEMAMIQHTDMVAKPLSHEVSVLSPLCEKHCVPDQAQKDPAQPQLVALPAAMTLTLNTPPCSATPHSAWSLTPPAAGPPATIRFCRFRE
ncbi:hypothetical protein GJV04_08765 [Enterobacteriaceae bacterium RIT714]|jgi:hypothetical protein|uniref:hypothetical protein n=1 Tax=Lelliottia sp. CFBP8978 TaxID=3096522 RepID=UPI0012ACDD29|nr:hypothetical protein [Lelliottia sp. CFBP8978]MDY1036312.1 hypothetical protein [Lelliottia sp. CFBP8978]MRS90129.1 hypothetical protein [Enterobacteriaceae bacterium RIT714]